MCISHSPLASRYLVVLLPIFQVQLSLLVQCKEKHLIQTHVPSTITGNMYTHVYKEDNCCWKLFVLVLHLGTTSLCLSVRSNCYVSVFKSVFFASYSLFFRFFNITGPCEYIQICSFLVPLKWQIKYLGIPLFRSFATDQTNSPLVYKRIIPEDKLRQWRLTDFRSWSAILWSV